MVKTSKAFNILLFMLASALSVQAAEVPANRVASIYLSQDFVNQQLALHHKSDLVKGMNVVFDPDHDQLLLRGEIHVPVEELRAINLDPKLGQFRFQLAVRLSGVCTFKYVGEEKDHSRAMEVTVDPKALLPAFPDLHLVGVDVREREFLMKIGQGL